MECSTEALEAMAKLVVMEMGQMGLEGKDIRDVETGMREPECVNSLRHLFSEFKL